MAAVQPIDQSHRLNLTEVDGYLIVNLPPVLTDQLLADYDRHHVQFTRWLAQHEIEMRKQGLSRDDAGTRASQAA